MHSSYLATGS